MRKTCFRFVILLFHFFFDSGQDPPVQKIYFGSPTRQTTEADRENRRCIETRDVGGKRVAEAPIPGMTEIQSFTLTTDTG